MNEQNHKQNLKKPVILPPAKTPLNQNSPAQERLLFEYTCALDTGDFEMTGALLEKAGNDPTLVKKLLELEKFLEGELTATEIPEKNRQAATTFIQAARANRGVQPTPISQNHRENQAAKVRTSLSIAKPVKQPGPIFQNNLKGSATSKESVKRSPNRLPFALVAGLAITLVASVALLLWSISRESPPAIIPSPAASYITGAAVSPTALPDPNPTQNQGGLTVSDYPMAQALTWDETASFPNGRPSIYQGTTIKAFATSDGYEKVAIFYQKQLEARGLAVSNRPEGCGSSVCSESNRVEAEKDGQQVVINARSPQVWQGNSEVSQQAFLYPLIRQLKSDQTLVVIMSGPVYPPVFTPDPTTASNTVAPTQATVKVAPTVPANTGEPLYLGPDNAFHRDDGTGRVSSTASKEVATSQPGITFKLSWLVSDAGETHLLGRFYVSGKLNEDFLQPGFSLEIGMLVDDQGQQYQLRILDGRYGRPNNMNSAYLYLNLAGPPLKPGVRQVTFKPGPGLPLSFATPPVLDLQTYREAGLNQGLLFNQAATANNRTLKAWAGYFTPTRTILNVGLSADGYQGHPLPADGNDYTSDNAVSLRVGENVTVTTDQGIELQAVEPALGEYMPFASLFLEPLPPGTRSLTIKLLNSSTATMVSTPEPPNQQLIKVPLADLLKKGPVTPGPELDLNGFKIKILREEASLDQASGKVSLKLSYQLPTASDASGKTLRAVYFACVKCSPDGNTSSGGGADTGPSAPREFTLKFNYSPDYSEVELRFDNVSYNLPGSTEITLPIPEVAAVAANDPAGKPAPPVGSAKKLGVALGKLSLGMTETEVVKALGAPDFKRTLTPGQKLVWDYPGMQVCGPVVNCIETRNFQTGITAEGFKLGQNRADFRQLYAGYTINDTPDPYRLLIKDSAGTILTAYFDEMDQAYRVLLSSS